MPMMAPAWITAAEPIEQAYEESATGRWALAAALAPLPHKTARRGGDGIAWFTTGCKTREWMGGRFTAGADGVLRVKA